MAPSPPPPQTKTEYKSNIMQRLGGENVFEFVVLGMVERLKQDSAMVAFFANYESCSSLISLQTTVLTAIFTKHPEDYDVDGFILLRYYCAIEQGFNETHFDILVKHFMDSLRDVWVEDDVLEDAVRIVNSFRPIFVSITTTGRIVIGEPKEDVQKIAKKKSADKPSRRGSSGELLLNLLRPKATKRTKQTSQ